MRSLTPRQRAVLLAACAANALVFFDQTSATVALHDIERDLGASPSQLQWVIGAYLLVLAALMPAAGRLADLHGRRRVFLAGVALFAAGSAACAAAPGIDALIALRAVQGAGASLSVPLALANVTAALPAERRGWAIGVLATGGTMFLALGPLLGGALVDAGGWRWVFAVAVPIALAAIALAWRALPADRVADPAPLDVPGLALLVAGLGTLVTGVLQASEWGAGSAATLGTIAGGVVLLAAFAVVERRAAHPLIHLRLLRMPAVAGSLAALLAIQFAVLAATVELMLYLQKALGHGALVAGLLFLPTVVGTPLLSPATGRAADRHGARRLVVAGLVLAAAALAAVAAAAGGGRLAFLLPAFLAFGVSRPLVITPASIAPVGALGEAERGLASSLVTEARQLGAVLGVAVPGLLVAAAERDGDLVGGVQTAIAVAAGACALAALIAAVLLRPRLRPGRPSRP